MEHQLGVHANVVMPTLASLALLGIDSIGTELENPFGRDANDLDILEMMTSLEREMMKMLELCEDFRARHEFVWMPVPEYVQDQSTKPFPAFLARRQEMQPTDIPDGQNFDDLHGGAFDTKGVGRARRACRRIVS